MQAWLIFLILPLALFLFSAAKARSTNRTFIDFLNPKDVATSTDFGDSSTAYGLQVASLSFFVALGFFAPLAGLINALAWLGGILLLFAFTKKIKPLVKGNTTIHGLIGAAHNSEILRIVASLVTIAGFMGFFVIELVFGTLILSAYGLSQTQIFAFVFSFGCFIAMYYSVGGHLSVFRTDQYQLAFAYFGLAVVFSWLAFHSFEPAVFWGFCVPFLLVSSLALIFAASSFSGWFEGSPHKVLKAPALPSALIKMTGVAFLVLSIGIILYGATTNMVSEQMAAAGDSNLTEAGTFFDHLWKLGDLGWLDIVSTFVLVPLVWQLSDTSNWHRIAGVIETDKENARLVDVHLRSGFRTYMRQSPATIIMTLVLGMGMFFVVGSSLGDDPYQAIYVFSSNLTASTFLIDHIVAIVFVVGVFSIMLSTADSLLSSSVFSFIYDTNPRTRALVDRYPYRNGSSVVDDKDNAHLSKMAKSVAFLFVVSALISYYILDYYSQYIVSILFAAFSAQISLAPAVVASLFLPNKASALFATLSVGCGAAVGIVVGILGAVMFESLIYLAPLFSFTTSILIYVAGLALAQQK